MAIWGRKKPWEDLGDFELPSFSATTLETLEVLRSDENTAEAAAEVMAQDPGLSVRVLRMVNSASFGVRRQVEDLAHAVQLVGRTSLESLVISLAVKDALPTDPPGLPGKPFWRAAGRRAAVARALARALTPSEASAQFTAALLSDMAVPLLAERMEKKYAAVLARRDAGEGELWELESETFGWHHGEIGGWMCEQWELPEGITQSIRAHHEGPGDPAALAAMLDESNPQEDAPRVAEIAAAESGDDPDALTERIRAALENADGDGL